MGPRKSEQFRSNWWGKTYADNTNRVAIKSPFPEGWAVGQMAPWIDCRPGRPSLIWGLNRLTLPGPTPCAEPTATPANENTKAFQISLGWPGQQITHYKHFLPVFPGVQEPLSFLSLPLDARNRQISFQSRLLAAAGLGLPRSDPVSSLHARAPGAQVPFPARLQSFGKGKPEARHRGKCGATGKTKYSPDSVS